MPQFSFVFLNLMFFHSYIFEGGEMDASLHDIISSAISLLLNFVLLKYEGKKESPFETNPKMVLLGVTSLLLYFSANDSVQRISSSDGALMRFAYPIYRCGLLFACFSIASLASLLYPDSATPFIFLLCTVIAVGDFVLLVCQRMWAKIRAAHFQVQLFSINLFRRITMHKMVNPRQQILP